MISVSVLIEHFSPTILPKPIVFHHKAIKKQQHNHQTLAGFLS
jgi:hypothetical protein